MANLPDKLCRAYRTGKDLEQTLASFLAAVLARSGFDGKRFRSSVPWAENFDSFENLSAKWSGEVVKHYKLDDVMTCIGKVSADLAAASLFKSMQPVYMIGWRQISNTTNRRSFIVSLLPYVAAGNSVTFARSNISIEKLCCLVSALSSMAIDYIVRNKLGGTNLNYIYVEQLPIAPPEEYLDNDIKFILPRFLELVYTATDMKDIYDNLISRCPYADLRNDSSRGKPFDYDPQRRINLICELDAYHAYKLGFTRDELQTILDSSRGEAGYPSESFRGLRDAEIKEFGEYRTQRLVLEAWDWIVEPLRRGQS